MIYRCASAVAAMSALQGYLERACPLTPEPVLAITQDGRVIIGTLSGFDSGGSVIISGSTERIFSPDAGVEEVPLGLYIVRGDSMCVCADSSLIGDLDIAADRALDLASIRAEPLPVIRHT